MLNAQREIRLFKEVRFIKVYFTECQLIFNFPTLTYTTVIIGGFYDNRTYIKNKTILLLNLPRFFHWVTISQF